MKFLFSTFFLIANTAALGADQYRGATKSEQWTREFSLGSTPTLYLRNVQGNISIEAHSADSILVEAIETRRARNENDLERSRDEIYLEVEQSTDLLVMEVNGPDHRQRGWRCRGCELAVDFVIKLPSATTLDIGSVNDGMIRIEGVSGNIDAHHVNDGIQIIGVKQCSKVATVNGNIEIEFADNPIQGCQIHTINGDMTVALPDNPNIDIAIDLHNGKVRSDFDIKPRATAAKVEHAEQNGRNRYRISKAAGLTLGAGGPELSFESINGNVILEQTH